MNQLRGTNPGPPIIDEALDIDWDKWNQKDTPHKDWQFFAVMVFGFVLGFLGGFGYFVIAIHEQVVR